MSEVFDVVTEVNGYSFYAIYGVTLALGIAIFVYILFSENRKNF